MNEPDVMVYLMTGFLDSGKTGFLKFTLKQDYFHRWKNIAHSLRRWRR